MEGRAQSQPSCKCAGHSCRALPLEDVEGRCSKRPSMRSRRSAVRSFCAGKFTITYHYLFPQLTMGLALLIVILKTMALRRRRALQPGGPLLGQDLRHQLRHGRRHRHPDGVSVRHQLGALLESRRRRHRPDAGHGGRVLVLPRIDLPGPVPVRREAAGAAGHWFTALMVFLGSWLSGYFIIATDAWMQHPVGYAIDARTADPAPRQLLGLLLNPWGSVAVPAQHDRRRWSRRAS